MATLKRTVLRFTERLGYTVLHNRDYQRMGLLYRYAVVARTDFENLAASLADSRRGHEQALRELEEARAEAYELGRLNQEAQLANQDLANQLSGLHNERQELMTRLGSLQMELREAQDRSGQLITEGQRSKEQLAGTLDENRPPGIKS